MTQRDDHLSFVQSMAMAVNLTRTAADKLDASPAWLRPSAGTVFADPALAQSAAELLDLDTRARAARRALDVLDADLDRVDVAADDPTAAARAEQAALAWLNQLDSADRLLAELVPDARRAYRAAASPRLTPEKAEAILYERLRQGGTLNSLALLQAGAGLDAFDVEDLLHTGRARDEVLPAGQSVGVLLPLRIETRFSPPTDARLTWQLRLRLYPEAASFDRHAGPPTQDEWDHTLAMWQAADGRLDTPAGRLAFRKLAEQHQGPRATWLARTLPPQRDRADGPITIPVVPLRPTDERRFDRPIGLPERLEVWLARAGGAPAMVTEFPVRADEIGRQVSLEGWGDGADLPTTWWLSFEQAVLLGLGTVIDLGPTGDDIDVLYVIGLGAQPPAPLFATHYAAGALAVIPPGTPTKTVAGAPAADLGHDPDLWRRMAWTSGLEQPAAREIELALTGGAAALSPLPGGEVDVRSPAHALVTALWPALWGRTLKDFLRLGGGSWELEWWAGRCLTPEGPFPAIRIGDQPYGVLPVSSLRRWRHPRTDPAIETRMLGPLRTLLNRWVAAGEAGGNVLGADTERFLDVLSRTPTHRWGWQAVFPETVMQAFMVMAAQPPDLAWMRQFFDRDVVAELEQSFGLNPSRRYYGAGWEQPISPEIFRATDPRQLLRAGPDWPSSCPPIKRMLDGEQHDEGMLFRLPDPDWWGWGGHPEDPHPVQFLARLVRHALILTRAEVLRRRDNPGAPAELLLLSNDASRALQVFGIVDEALLATVTASGPLGAAAVRAWRETRDGAIALCGFPPARLDQALLAVLDAATNRIDPWITGLATRRLRRFAAQRAPFRLGAYGWVDQPRPYPRRPAGTSLLPPGPTPAGLLHAPSPVQAVAGAILRDLGLRDPTDRRWDLSLDSQSIRAAVRLATDVQAGIHLKEALGREVERIAGDPALVVVLRDNFGMRPEHVGRQVCDGERVVNQSQPDKRAGLPAPLLPLADQFAALQRVLDTYGDLLVADAAFLLASGRGEQAAEAMEAAAGLGPPPSLRMLHTERGGRAVTTTVMAIFPSVAAPADAGPATLADPSFAALLESTLGGAASWTWQVRGVAVSLAQLGLSPIDVLVQSTAALEEAVRRFAAADPGDQVTPGTAPQLVAEARRISALVIGEGGLPDFLFPDAPAATAELANRLASLRAAATNLAGQLRGPDPGRQTALADVRRWGILPDPSAPDEERAQEAADVLDERLTATAPAAAPAPIGDVVAAGRRLTDLRAAIRTLAAGTATLPVVPTVPGASLVGLVTVPPAGDGRPSIDTRWLEAVAAVRPALARVDAHQLLARPIWAAWSSHPNDPWCTAAAAPIDSPAGTANQVRVAYGPPGALFGAAAPVALSLLDHWAETIPTRQHTTGAAFGFNAPKSRAPQSILVAVPPDVEAPLDIPTLVDILAETRMLTRARMATIDSLADVGTSIPLPLLLFDQATNFSHAGTDLERAKP